MIEAVVFDMDGVIVDSEPVWQEVREDLVHSHGSDWTKEDGDSCRGVSSDVWSTRISDRLGGALTPGEVFADVIGRMSSAYEAAVPFFPGAVEAMERIAMEYRIAIASGSPNVLIDLVVAHSGLQDRFAAVGYGDEVDRGKPSPDIYLRVLERMGVRSSDAVGVEDSLAGLRSVRAAGMHAVAVASPGYRLPADLIEQTALQLPSLADLTVPMIASINRLQGPHERETPG